MKFLDDYFEKTIEGVKIKFQRVLIDIVKEGKKLEIKKVICPKCKRPIDTRGIHLHWKGCNPAEEEPGEDPEPKEDKEEPGEDLMAETDQDKITNDIMGKVKNQMDEFNKGFDDKISKGFDGLKESLTANKDDHGEEDKDEDEDDNEDDSSILGDLDKEDYAIIGTAVTIILIICAIFWYMTTKANKDKPGETSKDTPKE